MAQVATMIATGNMNQYKEKSKANGSAQRIRVVVASLLAHDPM
jgi:hypothetical protein